MVLCRHNSLHIASTLVLCMVTVFFNVLWFLECMQPYTLDCVCLTVTSLLPLSVTVADYALYVYVHACGVCSESTLCPKQTLYIL